MNVMVNMFIAGGKEKTIMDTTHESVMLILLLSSIGFSCVIAQGNFVFICRKIKVRIHSTHYME